MYRKAEAGIGDIVERKERKREREKFSLGESVTQREKKRKKDDGTEHCALVSFFCVCVLC